MNGKENWINHSANKSYASYEEKHKKRFWYQ